MVAKLYGLSWAILSIAAGLLFLSSKLNDFTQTVLLFGVSTLVFAGVVGVFPWWINKQFTWRY